MSIAAGETDLRVLVVTFFSFLCCLKYSDSFSMKRYFAFFLFFSMCSFVMCHQKSLKVVFLSPLIPMARIVSFELSNKSWISDLIPFVPMIVSELNDCSSCIDSISGIIFLNSSSFLANSFFCSSK